VLGDPAAPDPASVTRLVFCSGKFGHELLARRDEIHAPVAIVRLEQLYRGLSVTSPPNSLATPARRSCGARGAWQHGAVTRPPSHRGDVLRRTVGVVARPASPSPASGSSTVHDAQQQALLEEAVPG